MAALNRFISRLGKKGLPFFELLKKSGKFEWSAKANEAFKKLKINLTSSLVLTPLDKQELLLLYIVGTTNVVSMTSVVEPAKKGHVYKVQRLVHYTSEVLSKSKVWYPHVQKLLYSLLITSCKLCHYFVEHKILVVTDYLLGDILCNCDAIGCISKWAIELGTHHIDFTPRKAI